MRSIESLQFAGGTGAFYRPLLFAARQHPDARVITVAEIDTSTSGSLPCVYDDTPICRSFA